MAASMEKPGCGTGRKEDPPNHLFSRCTQKAGLEREGYVSMVTQGSSSIDSRRRGAPICPLLHPITGQTDRMLEKNGHPPAMMKTVSFVHIWR